MTYVAFSKSCWQTILQVNLENVELRKYLYSLRINPSTFTFAVLENTADARVYCTNNATQILIYEVIIQEHPQFFTSSIV